MRNRLSIAVVDTPLGEIGLAGGEHGLVAVSFGRRPLRELISALESRNGDRGAGKLNPALVLDQACSELAEYVCNAREKFDVPLDISGGTEFQRAVWRKLRRLSWGKTTTYADLAAAIGQPGAARAVGNAVGSNPLPIFVPCHRVLAAGGRLGGFSGGLGNKRKLLAIESIPYKA